MPLRRLVTANNNDGESVPNASTSGGQESSLSLDSGRCNGGSPSKHKAREYNVLVRGGIRSRKPQHFCHLPSAGQMRCALLLPCCMLIMLALMRSWRTDSLLYQSLDATMSRSYSTPTSSVHQDTPLLLEHYLVSRQTIHMEATNNSSRRFPLVFGCGGKVRDEYKAEFNMPFFGGVQLNHSSTTSGSIAIDEHDYDKYEIYRSQLLEKDDELKHNTSQHKNSSSYYYSDELDSNPCQRPSWYDLYHPTCNDFHEIDLGRSTSHPIPNIPTNYHSRGGLRDAFMVKDSPPLILKTNRFVKDWKKMSRIQKPKREAAVMILLASSPRIGDVYGACGASVTVGALSGGHASDQFLPLNDDDKNNGGNFFHRKYGQQIELQDVNDQRDVKPLNNLTVTQKLEMSLAMAEGIADLHGFAGGPILHNDLSPDQWLLDDKGDIILGDFNGALALPYNVETNEYCKVKASHGEIGFYRSPEQILKRPADDKMEVFSMGSHIYSLLTGLRPYFQDEPRVGREKIVSGIHPFVDPRFRNRTFGEGELVRIMELCWEFDPDKRIEIFEVVRQLRLALTTHMNQTKTSNS